MYVEHSAHTAATGSWADDDFLPTARELLDPRVVGPVAYPSAAPKDPSAPKRGEPGYLDAMPDRGSRTYAHLISTN
jgi:hypothetical protein